MSMRPLSPIPGSSAGRGWPWWAQVAAAVLLTPPALSAQTTSQIDTTIVLQAGADYRGASDDGADGKLELHVGRAQGTAQAHILRFDSLQDYLRGERVEVVEARLELYYVDEWWTENTYYVTLSRSLDGTAENLDATPEGQVAVFGDKLPANVKTARPSWVTVPIRPETIEGWVRDPSSNHGLVLYVGGLKTGEQGDSVALHVGRTRAGWFVGFRSSSGQSTERPRLVVRYRVSGNAPPPPPHVVSPASSGALVSPATVRWAPSVDPNRGDRVHYEFQVGSGADGGTVWGAKTVQADEPGIRWPVEEDRAELYARSSAPPQEQRVWFRVRAVDDHGAASRWSSAGPFVVTRQPWSIWTLDGNRKAWLDAPEPTSPKTSIRLGAARNEWESFQVVVAGHVPLEDVSLAPTALTNADGDTLAAPVLYREHYVPILETANKQYGHLGRVPDALVPTIHPVTGRPTGGKYGGNRFSIGAGAREAFWLDLFVPSGASPGTYRGKVVVSAVGRDPVEVAVELEVWNFALPPVKHLKACFQLSESNVIQSHQLRQDPSRQATAGALADRYEQMLHEHDISNWSPITGFNYGLNGVKVSVSGNQVRVDWSEFDALVGPYMDGSAFPDGVPAQCLFVPYWLPVPRNNGQGWAPRVNQHNYENVRYDLFAQYVRQLEAHLREKGWLDRAYVFYFDEPFLSAWKYTAYVNTAKVIRREAPDLKIMLTDGYRGADFYRDKSFIGEPIERYVDVWDPVTFQVANLDLAEYYRQRKRDGYFDMWCQTLANANPNRGVINLFPEYDVPFHRMWGVMSWSLGFQGIEWWETIVWWNSRTKSRIDPWQDAGAFPGFRQPLNGDGRLFYSGTPDAIGGPDIPVASIRMKAVRDAIEDYEYLELLQETGRLDDFDLDGLYTNDAGKSEAMVAPMPMGREVWQWWEGDPDRIMALRAEMARLIALGPRRPGGAGRPPS